jgi:hypothetical protein
MKKRIILFLSIILILIICLIIFRFSNNVVIKEKDNVTFFLELIEKEADIEFSSISDSEIEWIVIDENNNVVVVKKPSREAFIQEASEQNTKKIDTFFEDNGFELDVYNIADGPEGGLRGYRKNKMYCIVKNDYMLNSDNNITNVDVRINCAI